MPNCFTCDALYFAHDDDAGTYKEYFCSPECAAKQEAELDKAQSLRRHHLFNMVYLAARDILTWPGALLPGSHDLFYDLVKSYAKEVIPNLTNEEIVKMTKLSIEEIVFERGGYEHKG